MRKHNRKIPNYHYYGVKKLILIHIHKQNKNGVRFIHFEKKVHLPLLLPLLLHQVLQPHLRLQERPKTPKKEQRNLSTKCSNGKTNREIMTSLRTGTNKLEIELGRHKKIPQNERICKQCDQKVVESEYHFIMKCPLYYEMSKICNGFG